MRRRRPKTSVTSTTVAAGSGPAAPNAAGVGAAGGSEELKFPGRGGAACQAAAGPAAVVVAGLDEVLDARQRRDAAGAKRVIDHQRIVVQIPLLHSRRRRERGEADRLHAADARVRAVGAADDPG